MEERGGQREDSGPPLLIGYLGTFHGFVLFFLEGMEGWRIGLDWIQHVLRVLCHSSFVFVFFGGGGGRGGKDCRKPVPRTWERITEVEMVIGNGNMYLRTRSFFRINTVQYF